MTSVLFWIKIQALFKMKYTNFLFLLSLPILFFLLLQTRATNPKTDTTVEPVKQVVVNPPAFSADSAYAYTQAQVDFGPRTMNSKAHEACAAWLIQKIKKLTDTVYVQKFEGTCWDGTKLKCTNIIASINPKATTRILLTSHWDSRPWADEDTVDKDKPVCICRRWGQRGWHFNRDSAGHPLATYKYWYRYIF